MLSSGCATQASTAQALAIAGTAAVIIGASLAADGDCSETIEAGGFGYCSPGLNRGTRHAGTAVAFAGLGVAAAGYALQPNGPDRSRRPAPAALAPTQSYRLIRTTPPERDPSEQEPASETGVAPDVEAAPEAHGGSDSLPAGVL
jgi:hypothetical protein